MTAVNPIPPNATPERDQRPYEPSMEEILASIRRIIADDQSLPGRQDSQPAVEQPVAEVRPPEPDATTVHVLRPAPAALDTAPPPAPIERASPEARQDHDTMRAPAPTSFVAHGHIAPQYATPGGPVAPLEPPHHAPVDSGPAFDDDHIDAETANRIASGPGSHRDTLDEPSHAPGARPPFPPEVASVYDEPLGRHEPLPFEPLPFEPLPFEPVPVDPTPLFSDATHQSITSAFNTLAASRLADNADDLLSMSREMIRPLLKTWLDENLPSMVERLVRAEIERVARGGR